MKRIESIAVRNSKNEIVAFFAPNFIGRTEQELMAKAEKMAAEVAGHVTIKFKK